MADPLSLASPEAVAAAIRRTRRPAGGSDSWDFSMEYRAPNGRRFEVRELDDGRMFMSEFVPMGRVCMPDGSFGEPRGVKAALRDPNGFEGRLRARGIDPDQAVRGGAGFGLGSRYFDGLDAVAGAIVAAIASNSWYDSVDRKLLRDPAFRRRTAQAEVAMRAEWERQKAEDHAEAVAVGQGIFKGLHNMFGPLDKERRDMIMSYLNAPDEAGWNAIASTCVKGMRTLWQAWTDVDPAAPRSKSLDGGWPRIPDPETLRAAMRAAAGLSPDEEPDAAAGAEVVSLRP